MSSPDRDELIRHFENDPELAQDIAMAFRELSVTFISNAEAALARRDRSALADATHSMKGAASHFPAKDLYDALADLETAPSVQEARICYARVLRKLRELDERLETLF